MKLTEKEKLQIMMDYFLKKSKETEISRSFWWKKYIETFKEWETL